jgi:hypothetical protein
MDPAGAFAGGAAAGGDGDTGPASASTSRAGAACRATDGAPADAAVGAADTGGAAAVETDVGSFARVERAKRRPLARRSADATSAALAIHTLRRTPAITPVLPFQDVRAVRRTPSRFRDASEDVGASSVPLRRRSNAVG